MGDYAANFWEARDPDRRRRVRRRHVIGTLVGLAVAIVAIFLGLRFAGFLVPGAAERAALRLHEAGPGSSQQWEILDSAGWSDCAVVVLAGADDQQVSLALYRDGSRWVIGRTSDAAFFFDVDDVMFDHGRCLSLATSRPR